MPPRWLAAALHPGRLPEVWRCARRLRGWPRLLRAYLRLGAVRYPLEVRARGGFRFEVRDFHDLVTAWVVFCRDEYAVDPASRCVVDVGANYGAFTLWAAAAAPAARIVSVEPQPREHARLQANLAANHLDGRVACWLAAVAREGGERWMSDAPLEHAPSRALLPAHAVPSGPAVRVRVHPLGELLDRVRRET
ncbi:MAG TPA: FkbM family methyltransferase, partial [Longimicrobiaceae bacterium]|nr:FkbM family methyltransferase [Longimicrobiaceae bacterium]